MSKVIEIKITIPEHEYKQWTAFERGGTYEVELQASDIIRNSLKQNFIDDFEIETTTNPH
jgi:hypothetical protein